MPGPLAVGKVLFDKDDVDNPALRPKLSDIISQVTAGMERAGYGVECHQLDESNSPIGGAEWKVTSSKSAWDFEACKTTFNELVNTAWKGANIHKPEITFD